MDRFRGDDRTHSTNWGTEGHAGAVRVDFRRVEVEQLGDRTGLCGEGLAAGEADIAVAFGGLTFMPGQRFVRMRTGLWCFQSVSSRMTSTSGTAWPRPRRMFLRRLRPRLIRRRLQRAVTDAMVQLDHCASGRSFRGPWVLEELGLGPPPMQVDPAEPDGSSLNMLFSEKARALRGGIRSEGFRPRPIGGPTPTRRTWP